MTLGTNYFLGFVVSLEFIFLNWTIILRDLHFNKDENVHRFAYCSLREDFWRETERYTERERDKDIYRERETVKYTERETESDRETERVRQRQWESQRETERDRNRKRQREWVRQRERKRDKVTERKSETERQR